MKNIQSIFLDIFLGIVFLITPYIVHAEVIINEISWMGNNSSANAEWIELWNNSDESVNFSGWTLVAVDDSPRITLSGTLRPHEYYLLERTAETSVPDIVANSIYSGALANTGEHLVLKDDLSNVIDEIDATSGWPAGDNTKKETMQRVGDSWITAPGTPKQSNRGAEDVSDTTSVENHPTSPQDTSAEEKEDVEKIKPDPTYTAKMDMPEYVLAGVDFPVRVQVTKNMGVETLKNISRGRFIWVMGDGRQYDLMKNNDIHHIFYYPGTYVVTLVYYSSPLNSEPDSIHRKKILVIPPALEIIGATDDQGIIIENSSSKIIDMDQWKIHYQNHEYVFPRYTTIGSQQKLFLSSRVLGFVISQYNESYLINPQGMMLEKTLVKKTSNEDISDERVQNSKELNHQNSEPMVRVIPAEKSFIDLWKIGKWYMILGIISGALLLAYFCFRLYSERNHLLHDDD